MGSDKKRGEGLLSVDKTNKEANEKQNKKQKRVAVKSKKIKEKRTKTDIMPYQ